MFEQLTVKELKVIIKEYNLHTKISGYSRMRKSDLITEMQKHMTFENNKIKMKSNPTEIDAEQKVKAPVIKKEKRPLQLIKLRDITDEIKH